MSYWLTFFETRRLSAKFETSFVLELVIVFIYKLLLIDPYDLKFLSFGADSTLVKDVFIFIWRASVNLGLCINLETDFLDSSISLRFYSNILEVVLL